MYKKIINNLAKRVKADLRLPSRYSKKIIHYYEDIIYSKNIKCMAKYNKENRKHV